MLRQLYPHVDTWGQLVESTNSRQREGKLERARQQRMISAGQRPTPKQPPPPPPPTAGGKGVQHAGSGPPPVLGGPGSGVRVEAEGAAGQDSAASAFHVPDAAWGATRTQLLDEIGVNVSLKGMGLRGGRRERVAGTGLKSS
jgi:hypothetical protein